MRAPDCPRFWRGVIEVRGEKEEESRTDSGGQETRGPSIEKIPKGESRVDSFRLLLEHNCPERPHHIVAWAGGKEQRVPGAIGRLTTSEIDCPELVNVDYSTGRVLHGTHERSRLRIEGVDGALVDVV